MKRGRKPKDSPLSEVIYIRMSKETHDFFEMFGDEKSNVIREILDDYRIAKNGKALDHKLYCLRAELGEVEARALELRNEIRNAECQREAIQTKQMAYLEVRQNLVEKYARNPDRERFEAWIGGPAQEHYVEESRFNNPKEVAEFCHNEWAKRKGQI